ncbi:hypothetical protein D9V32_00870 [Mycetocola tolaasinivorans]|uniref:Small multidrug efflux protein n=1 Tax=Mycetocola tolaasinivorans TaxID=76635 RepID=A0A3L7ACG6_9MICO|nr:small multi-drug export protein [Mycetocola tolaasinivorans]RLP77917.1 hypothetical protein D9V32_00870 [Mycetocola tolaasinivorans]
MIDTLQDFVSGLPEWLQVLGVVLIGMIPFVESYLGTVIGVFAGLNPIVAASAAIAGNLIIVLALIFGADAIRERARKNRTFTPDSPRREKVRRMLERFGVPGVSLLVHPIQITSLLLIGLGAKRAKVILWQVVSIVAWGVVTGTIASFGLAQLLH